MPYRLDCGSCEFTTRIREETDTYAVAREHESAHPEHYVFIVEATEESGG
jgi:hypothetical protein